MISRRQGLAVVLALFVAALCAISERTEAEWEPVYEHGVDLFESTETIHMCNASDTANWYIYCSGKLLEAVNIHGLFNDSKDFVDMPLVLTPEETRQNFESLFGNTSVNDMNKEKLVEFVNQHFSKPGSELMPCTPTDWVDEPSNFKNISDPQLRQWAMQLNAIWKHLCKQIRPEIESHINRYSLIYVPNMFIAPGGRFREFYYWDAYWIIKGLLASGMHNTAALMIRNLADMVTRFGFVPNGGRVYYLRRSQPPMLTGMVYDYYEATHNLTFLKELLPIVMKELNFWDQQRSISVTAPDGTNHTVYRYRTSSNVPRPESFKEDMMHSAKMNETEKQFYYRATASSAESGWDFSTRWFKDHMNIETIETHKIIPVDLNAIVCWNLDILEYLNEQVGNFTQSEIFRDRRAHFRETVEKVFYNETTGAWHDYGTRTHLHNTNFYPSVAVPLFTGCYNDLDQSKSERLYTYIQNLGAFDYAGGVPSSLIQGSGEQWDFPNGWSPSQHFLIEGLRKSENPKMQDQAFRIATKWVQGNYKVFKATSFMWEKYNVIGSVPQPGKGGEYEVQDGFGWTNGVILDLLLTYSDRLSMAPIKGSSEPPPTGPNGNGNGQSGLAPSFGLPLLFAIILLALQRT